MYGKSLYENDDVIKEIEKFMLEYEDPRMSPILVNKGRIYDSDKDLLNILDSDNDRCRKITTPNLKDYHIPLKSHATALRTHDPNKKTNISPANLKPRIFSVDNHKKSVSNSHKGKTHQQHPPEVPYAIPTCSVPPKKRKVIEEEGPPKKMFKDPKKEVKISKKEEAKTAKKEEVKKTRGRPRKCHKATVVEFKKPEEFKCPEVRRERVIPIVHVPHRRYRAKVSIDRSYCDSVTSRNVSVKKEVIDLTNLNSFYTCLKFAEIHDLQLETVTELVKVKPVKAVVREKGDLIDKPTVFKPEIRIDTNISCVDLTDDREAEAGPTIASEKELANHMLPIIFNCNRIYEANKKVEEALLQIQECLSPQIVESDLNFTVKFMPKHTACLGSNLIQRISHLFVRNLNIQRFLDILSSKISTIHGVILKPPMISSFLFTMLDENRVNCQTQLTKDLLQQLETHTQELKVKEEKKSEAEVMFTREQLERLHQQIIQYKAILSKQSVLVKESVSPIVKAESGVVDKAVKEELLDAELAEERKLPKNVSEKPPYIIVIDD